MFCKNCGAKNPDDAKFCAKCGIPLAVPPVPLQPETPEPPVVPKSIERSNTSEISDPPEIPEATEASESSAQPEPPVSEAPRDSEAAKSPDIPEVKSQDLLSDAELSDNPETSGEEVPDRPAASENEDPADIPGIPSEPDIEIRRRPEMVRPPENIRVPEESLSSHPEKIARAHVPAGMAPGETRTASGTQSKSHKKLWLIPILIIVVLGTAAYFTGKYLTDPSRTVDAFEQAVRDQNVSELKSLIQPNEHTSVTDAQIRAMLSLFKNQPDTYHSIVTALDASAASPSRTTNDTPYYLQRSGKKFLIFDNYRIGTDTVQAKVTTNLQGMQVGIQGIGQSKVASEADSNTPQTLTVGPVIPGEYTIYGKSKTLNTTKVVSLTSSGKSVDFSGIYVRVSSNISDAELFVNDQDTGKTIAEAGEYGPFKKNDTPVFYAKYTVNGKSIQTSPVSITPDGSNYDDSSMTLDDAQNSGIELDFSEVDSGDFYVLNSNDEQGNIDTLNSYFSGFYDALSNAVSSGETSDFANYFESGTSYAAAQLKNAQSFNKQGISESNSDYTINSVQSLGNGVFSAQVDESWDEEITDPNTGDYTTKSFSYTNTYKLQETAPGTLKIIGQSITNRQDTTDSSSSSDDSSF